MGNSISNYRIRRKAKRDLENRPNIANALRGSSIDIHDQIGRQSPSPIPHPILLSASFRA
jgi:hypothetical protein